MNQICLRAGMLLGLLVLGLAVVRPGDVAAGAGLRVTGGGTGTFLADLDGDGNIDGSHFGIGAHILGDGEAKGHFECLMAGNTAILGLPIMAVSGTVTGGAENSPGNVTLSGLAKVILGNGLNFNDVPFEVILTEGIAGEATIQLHLMGGYAGGPGDFDLPVEVVATGRIMIR